MKIDTYKVWAGRDDVELTTFLNMPDAFFPNPIKKPAIIVCPGGAYQMCPRHGNEGDPVAMTFAAMGFQTFVLEYSVGSRSKAEDVLFPNQLYDFGKAILMIREHADEWCVDIDRISIMGFSAGAHLCGMMATCWNENLLKDKFGLPNEVFKPLSAVLLYGLHDYEYQNSHLDQSKKEMLPENLDRLTFGTDNPDSEMLKLYSPYYHVSKDTVPIFMAAAIDDGMIPAMQSVRMAAKLQETGIPYELHMFEYGDHGFALGRNLTEPFREEKAHACSAWLELAKTFLMHHISPESTEKERNPLLAFEAAMNQQK